VIARPPEETEAAAVANLTDAFVPDPISPELVRTIWTEPGFERKRDARVALESGSEVTGYAHAATLGDDDIRARVPRASSRARGVRTSVGSGFSRRAATASSGTSTAWAST